MSKILNTYCQTAIAYVEKLANAPLTQITDRYKDVYSDKKGVDAGAGIYGIYENDILMYIGRTDNIVSRLSWHCRPSSNGFTLAKRFVTASVTKEKAAERVKKMQVRFVKIEDTNMQALTELLAYIELSPRYGDFENH